METETKWKINDTIKEKEEAVKKVRKLLSAIFAIIGVTLLISQFYPMLLAYGEGVVLGMKDELRKKPMTDQELQKLMEDKIYDPGQSYFQNMLLSSGLAYQAGSMTYDIETHKLKEVKINESYSKNMKLSIPDVNINPVKVEPNVNSYEEKVYDLVLKDGLAHFKGTPIPGDGGNSFIYGHSTAVNFLNKNPNNPEIVFTKLGDVEIGDEVNIEREGETLKYVVRKTKKVSPTDFSVVKGSSTKETVTLMTCWPPGLGTERWIVVAERTE